MSDQVLATAGRWSVASDGIQWILRRHNDQGSGWHPLSFVHSTRDVLARCMREKGVPVEDAAVLLAGLPATFDPDPPGS
jgi:hypothetical protein